MRLLALLALLPSCAAPQDGPAPRPNVIVILADDLGYADLGCHGAKDIPTPHLDALAAGGVRCTSGTVSHPFCSPTRAGLLAGRYQQRFGHENNPKWDPADETLGLPVQVPTVADALRAAGYRTGAVGKWHLGAAPRFHPNRRGFDEYFGILGGGHQYFPVARSAAEYSIPVDRNGQAVDEPEYLTRAFSREAAAFVERHRGRPFFLYLAYNAPHTPMQAPKETVAKFASIADEKRRTYAAMVSEVDDGVGLVLRRLRELGLEERTLVFFLSDNGGPPSANASSNGPLRGAKGQVYEGGIRVPFLVRWPGRLRAGATYDAPVSSIDLFATAAAAAGARAEGLEGVDLVPYLAGEKAGVPHERLFWRSGGGERWAVREGNWKLLDAGEGRMLFDLAADPGETTDLASKHPDVAERLARAYADWDRGNVKPLWDNPRAAPRKQP